MTEQEKPEQQEKPAQEKPEQELEQEGPDKKKLWKLYAQAKMHLRSSPDDPGSVDAFLNQYTRGEIKDMASLETLLEIGKAPETRFEKLQGASANVLEGMTLGHAGELIGGVKALAGGDYAGSREEIENRIESHRAEYPKSSLLGEVSGGVLPFVSGGGGAAGGEVGGIATRAITGFGKGMVGGAGTGAVYGHGTAEPGERTKGTATGGVLGGAVGGPLGGLLPVVGAGARRLGLGVMDMMGPGGRAMASKFRQGGAVTNIANAELQGAVDDVGRPMKELTKDFAGMPQKAPGQPYGSAPVDLDPVLARQAQASRIVDAGLDRQGGPVRAIESRQLARGRRMVDDLRHRTGLERPAHPDEVLTAAQSAWRETHLRPLQESVDNFGSMRLGKLLKEFPEIAEELRLAGQNMDDLKAGQLSFDHAWDALQEMRHRIGGRMNSNAKEGLIERASAFQDLMEEAIPAFRESQRAYRALNARHDAYLLGKQLRTKPSAEIRHGYETLGSDSERIVFREAMMDGLEDALIKNPLGGNTARELVRGGDQRAKLRVLFDDDHSFNGWLDQLDDEGRWAITANALQGSGSPQQIADAGKLGGYVTTGRAIMNEILSVIFEDPTIRKQVGRQVGQVLTTQGPEAAVRMAMRLAKARGVGTMNTRAASFVGGQTVRELGGVLSSPKPSRPKSIFE